LRFKILRARLEIESRDDLKKRVCGDPDTFDPTRGYGCEPFDEEEKLFSDQFSNFIIGFYPLYFRFIAGLLSDDTKYILDSGWGSCERYIRIEFSSQLFEGNVDNGSGESMETEECRCQTVINQLFYRIFANGSNYITKIENHPVKMIYGLRMSYKEGADDDNFCVKFYIPNPEGAFESIMNDRILKINKDVAPDLVGSSDPLYYILLKWTESLNQSSLGEVAKIWCNYEVSSD
jgi:hypothetical protein